MSRPRTGQRRQTHQPVKIDRLPPSVHEAILALRRAGKTWLEIENLSAQPFAGTSPKALGFVDWDNLPTDVLELFPHLRIPHTNLHRWHDLRIDQVQADVRSRSIAAREIAAVFAKSAVSNDKDAVINAARDTLMGVLSEDGSADGRQNTAKHLIKLGELMNKVTANEIRERAVAVAEQELQAKLDEIKRKTSELLTNLGVGRQAEAVPLTSEQLVDKVREIYGLT